MIARFFGHHGVDGFGHLNAMDPQNDEHRREAPSSTFPPALIEENRATIARMRAARSAGVNAGDHVEPGNDNGEKVRAA